jgi:hypothetical protein
MNPLSMESIFLILSGVILAAGVLYWFWSHIQLTQKKVQLLENAVFELRGLVQGSPDRGSLGKGTRGDLSDAGNGETVYADLSDDDWEGSPAAAVSSSTPLTNLQDYNTDTPYPVSSNPDTERVVEFGKLVETETPSDSMDERFRALFKQETVDAPGIAASAATSVAPSPKQTPTTEPLENMPVRDLRRLAEQRGLTGVADMKKKEILAALRAQITSAPAPFEAANSSKPLPPLVVEKTLDLEAMASAAAEAPVEDDEAIPLE